MRLNAFKNLYTFYVNGVIIFNLISDFIYNELRVIDFNLFDLVKSKNISLLVLKNVFYKKKILNFSFFNLSKNFVFEYVYFYENQLKNNFLILKKIISEDLENIYNIYIYIYYLFVNFSCLEDKYLDNDDFNFFYLSFFPKNRIINSIKDNDFFSYIFNKKKVSFKSNNLWYKAFIKYNNYKKNLFSFNISSIEKDRFLLFYLLNNIIFKNKIIKDYLDNLFFIFNFNIEAFCKSVVNIFGFYHKDFNNSFIRKKINFFHTKYYSYKNFYTNLIIKSVIKDKEYDNIIIDSVKNWSINDMIFLDKIIIKITISEVKNFNIPIRVSINEYLDISKIYSTNKSSKFINGVLNSILNLKKN